MPRNASKISISRVVQRKKWNLMQETCIMIIRYRQMYQQDEEWNPVEEKEVGV